MASNEKNVPLIRFDHVDKQYKNQKAVKDLTLQINRGDFFVIVGASGSGKTTTLKMINRLINPTSGTISFDGVDIAQKPLQTYRHHIGYVLQTSALFPNMTVAENAAVTLNAIGISNKQARPTIEQLLDEVGMDPQKYMERYPHELSGGEQQRVGIVRALAAKPDVILMDEPFSALDPISRKQLQDLVLQLHTKLKTTIIFVTHDMNEALRLGNKIAVMNEGCLLQIGLPSDIILHPATPQVAALFEGQQEQTLADMIALRYYQPRTNIDTTNLPNLPVGASMQQLAQTLLKTPQQQVVIDEAYVITNHDYLAYMARE